MIKKNVCALSVEALSVLLGCLQAEEASAAKELQEAQERHLKAQQAKNTTWQRYLLVSLENAHREALTKADACQEQRGQYIKEAERISKALTILLGQSDAMEAAA